MARGWATRWPKRKEAKLRKLWAAGHSASLIAKKLGYSRTAILGKVHRLKLGPHEIKHSEYRVANPEGRSARYRDRKKAGEDTRRKVRIGRRLLPIAPEMTKSELRAMLTQAVLNTATLVEGAA